MTAKVIVYTATALVVGVASCFVSFFVFQWLRAPSTLRSSIGDPGVLRAVIGGGLFLTALGLLGLGLGVVIRSSAGGIGAVMGVLLLPPLLLELLPDSWRTTVGPYTPMQAGNQIYLLHHEPGALGPWAGLGVLCLYAAAADGDRLRARHPARRVRRSACPYR